MGKTKSKVSKMLKIVEKIKQDYNQYTYLWCKDDEAPYCYVGDPVIYYYPFYRISDEEDVFSLLHEIGHLEANTPDMSDYQKEYLATEWAIKHSKKYKITLTQECMDDWDIYIKGFHKRSDGKKLALKWA